MRACVDACVGTWACVVGRCTIASHAQSKLPCVRVFSLRCMLAFGFVVCVNFCLFALHVRLQLRCRHVFYPMHVVYLNLCLWAVPVRLQLR